MPQDKSSPRKDKKPKAKKTEIQQPPIVSPTVNNDETTVNKYKTILLGILGVAILVLGVFFALNLKPESKDVAQEPAAPIAEDIDREDPVFLRIGLSSPPDCETVLNYYQDNALKQVTAWGLHGNEPVIGFPEPAIRGPMADVISQTSEASSAESAGDYSQTNIQVQGVEEADFVKTDGNYIYVLDGKTVKIIDVRQTNTDTPPAIVGKVDLDTQGITMLLSLKPSNNNAGNLIDTLIILARGDSHSSFRLVQIDINNREAPRIIADFTVDGRYTGVRMADNVIRLSTVSSPLGFKWQTPAGSGLLAEENALEANKELIRNSTLSNWVPSYKDNLNAKGKTDFFVDCAQMLIPNVFSGLDTLSITTFESSKRLNAGDWRGLGLAASGESIYATTNSFYVATQEITDEKQTADGDDQNSLQADLKTIIHKFGIKAKSTSLPARPVYVASGEVDGTLLNQFAMDEYQGDLRVAVTLESFSARTRFSENHVKILRPNKGVFEEIGAVTGLGVNERIFAVRFMGAEAYVVTFQRIDPLYALDLSDPTNPKALGELKITGFSSYLHPVGENLLLGIGQEANLQGQTEGLQISLFDTSDNANLKRVDQLLVADTQADSVTGWSSSPAENDHHAFLFHDDVSYVPYNAYWRVDRPTDTLPDTRRFSAELDAGILALEVKDNRSLSVKYTLKASTQKGNDPDKTVVLEPIRTIVVDDLIYGLTDRGELITWQSSDGEFLHTMSY